MFYRKNKIVGRGNKMAKTEQELYDEMAEAVVEMDEDLAADLANEVVELGYDAFDAIDKGLAKGMEEAGQLFEEEEYFVPELLMCADALNVGVDILQPHIKTEARDEKHKIVIGVIQGDTHDIGKNLVKLMADAGGFEVINLGRDVPPDVFVDKAIEEGAEFILISSLMTTTMDGMAEVVRILNERGIRDNHKVLVGGGPVSQGFADKIGADGYADNANQAVRLLNSLVKN
jgi:corrinoid protein of di/trimethylamine methyltransferase